MARKIPVEKEAEVGEDAGEDIQQRFPRVLAERVDRLMQLSDAGFVSRKAFLAEAVREKLEREEAKVMERAAFRNWAEEMVGKGGLKGKR